MNTIERTYPCDFNKLKERGMYVSKDLQRLIVTLASGKKVAIGISRYASPIRLYFCSPDRELQHRQKEGLSSCSYDVLRENNIFPRNNNSEALITLRTGETLLASIDRSKRPNEMFFRTCSESIRLDVQWHPVA